MEQLRPRLQTGFYDDPLKLSPQVGIRRRVAGDYVFGTWLSCIERLLQIGTPLWKEGDNSALLAFVMLGLRRVHRDPAFLLRSPKLPPDRVLAEPSQRSQ